MTVSAVINADGTMKVHGVDYGNGSRPLLVWKRTRDYLVMKSPGGKYWSGIGMQAYGPARFNVFRILEQPAGTESSNTRAKFGKHTVRLENVIDIAIKAKED